MLAKAKSNDLAGLMNMDVSASKHLVAYKAQLVAEFEKIGKETVTTEFLGSGGGTTNASEAASAISAAFAHDKTKS